MKRILFFALYCVLGLSSLMAQDFSRYVDPRIGSEGLGRTFPGPCMPYGMAKPGPDAVSMPNAGWAPMPELIKGFSQMHVSGAGGGQKYGNILIQPFLDVGEIIQKRVDEKIALGYYACTFENGIWTEITASERCAFYRLDYGRKQKGKLLIDVATILGIDTIPDKRETQQYVDSYVTCDGKYAVSGWSTVRGGWNNGGPYTVYFYLQSDAPLSNSDVPLSNSNAPLYNKPYNEVKESKTRLDVAFSKSTVNLKIGISHISIAQARQNIPACGFDAQLKNVRKTWNEKLGKIEIAGTEKQKRMFYTALYHTMLMPVDKSGENPHFSAMPYYDDYYAIWDTYRTSMPLLTLIEELQQRDMVNSLLNIYKHDGYMPDARSGNWNGRTQGGSNADIVIADAFAKEMKGIDYELALKAMIKDVEVPPTDDDGGAMSSWLVFNMLGFYPIAGQNLYIVGSPMIPEYTIHLSNGKDLKVVREGEQWKQMFITHDVLINGGKLVLPDFKTEGKGVDKTQKLLIMKEKEKSTVFAQPVDKYLITIPAQYVARFIVNRQYRNWEVGVDSTSMADTLILKCNQSLYLIPRKVVDEADGFCWDSPQKGRNVYVCDMSSNKGMRDGTFLFISQKALRQLQANGSFVYNGILWRKISADEKSITVKAEQDGTIMQIAANLNLPWVLRMEGNPLGIDWRLEKQ